MDNSPPPSLSAKGGPSHDRWEFMLQSLAEHQRLETQYQIAPADNKPPRPELSATLRKWIENQRYQANRLRRGLKSFMTPSRIERLEEVISPSFFRSGFMDPEVQCTWGKNYGQLIQFKLEHGHVNVPWKYKNNQLANFVRLQRVNYKSFQAGKRNSSLTQDRINKLEKLGFVWKVKDPTEYVSFDERFEQLLEYRNQHGSVEVPRSDTEHKALNRWIQRMRKQYKLFQEGNDKATITQQMIHQLDSIGFVWNAGGVVEGWDVMLYQLEFYMEEYGGERPVPRTAEYKKLADWVHTQRKQYKKFVAGEHSQLNEERIARLESVVGWKWYGGQRNRKSASKDQAVTNEKKGGDNAEPCDGEDGGDGNASQVKRGEDVEVPLLPPMEQPEIDENIALVSEASDRREGRSNAKTKSEVVNPPAEVQGFPNHRRRGMRLSKESFVVQPSETLRNSHSSEEESGSETPEEERNSAKPRSNDGAEADRLQKHPTILARELVHEDEAANAPRNHASGREMALQADSEEEEENDSSDGEEPDERNEAALAIGDPHSFSRAPPPGWEGIDSIQPRGPDMGADANRGELVESSGNECDNDTDEEEEQPPQKSPRPKRTPFLTRFEQLLRYKMENGHFNVTPKENAVLYYWMKEQRFRRKQFKAGKLGNGQGHGSVSHKEKAERIAMLDSIGFPWRKERIVPSDPWETYFSKLISFKQEHGHCDVPTKSKPRKLRKWVQRQRSEYKHFNEGQPSTITQEKIDKLESIGFQWTKSNPRKPTTPNPQKKTYEEMCTELEAFQREHGHLEVTPDYPKLYKFLKYNSADYRRLRRGKKSIMSERKAARLEQIEGLKELMMQTKMATFEEMCTNLGKFRQEHGHVEVPRNSKEHSKLYSWVRTQRTYHRKFVKGLESLMTAERAAMLEAIDGWTWEPTSERYDSTTKGKGGHGKPKEVIAKVVTPRKGRKLLTFEQRFEQLKEYLEVNGHIEVRPDKVEHLILANFIRHARSEYKSLQEGRKSSMTQARIDLLESLEGWTWQKRVMVGWDAMFERLKTYMDENGGSCKVPKGEYQRLSCWVTNQKKHYRKFKEGMHSQITEERIAKLDSIGFDWRAGKPGRKMGVANRKGDSTGPGTMTADKNDKNDESVVDGAAVEQRFDVAATAIGDYESGAIRGSQTNLEDKIPTPTKNIILLPEDKYAVAASTTRNSKSQTSRHQKTSKLDETSPKSLGAERNATPQQSNEVAGDGSKSSSNVRSTKQREADEWISKNLGRTNKLLQYCKEKSLVRIRLDSDLDHSARNYDGPYVEDQVRKSSGCTYHRCVVCQVSCGSKKCPQTRFYCATCQVPLCMVPRRSEKESCFDRFHTSLDVGGVLDRKRMKSNSADDSPAPHKKQKTS